MDLTRDTDDRQPEQAALDPSAEGVPEYPRMRVVEPQLLEHEGRLYVSLKDPIGLARQAVLVPQVLAPLLDLCDGTRDVRGLRAALALTTGTELTEDRVRDFVQGMDAALFLENGAFRAAAAAALREYREAEHRSPALADTVYPADPDALTATLDGYCAKAPPPDGPLPASATLRGVVCPHIDYERGNGTYAQLWQRCAPALEDVELAIILGTDHSGSPGSVTLTRQDYATPFGVLPTDREIVDGLAEVLGEEKAFAEELHHGGEHSIELASVWFHHFTGGRPCPIVPILCGSFHEFVTALRDPAEDDAIEGVTAVLQAAMSDRRTLVIAAADLAHVGPTFGDAAAIDAVGRAGLDSEDAVSIAAMCDSDAAAFFEISRSEADRRRLCGLPPIYLMLRLLGRMKGESLGYAQCPADLKGGSLVSIVGALLYEEG